MIIIIIIIVVIQKVWFVLATHKNKIGHWNSYETNKLWLVEITNQFIEYNIIISNTKKLLGDAALQNRQLFIVYVHFLVYISTHVQM